MDYFLAIVLPPFGLASVGKWGQALLCFFLWITCVGWPIAAIWALCVVADTRAQDRAQIAGARQVIVIHQAAPHPGAPPAALPAYMHPPAKPAGPTPEQLAWQEQLASERVAANAERAIERERIRQIRADWFRQTITEWGWYRALPETGQYIVIGLALTVPVIALIGWLMR